MRAIDSRSEAIETVGWKFPHYTAAEAAADRALHLLALPTATVAVAWLFLAAIPTADAEQTVASLIYGCGLIGMLTASAAYNLCRPSRRKELLRRVDHAMIFVMIAGTYTPFAVSAFREIDGPLLCLVIWSLAATGVAVVLAFPRRFERLLLMLYLTMGWMVLGMGACPHPESLPIPERRLARTCCFRSQPALGGNRPGSCGMTSDGWRVAWPHAPRCARRTVVGLPPCSASGRHRVPLAAAYRACH